MAKVTETVYQAIEPTVKNQGVALWDVVFVKEGASWYLRVYIDKEDGVGIDDCVNVSHAIDPIIDELDPIDMSYCLEVCSPGIERELTREWHFSESIGKNIKIKLFKAREGTKEFVGVLEEFAEGECRIQTQNGIMNFKRNEIAKANLEVD